MTAPGSYTGNSDARASRAVIALREFHVFRVLSGSVVGIELGRADCRWRVTNPALSVAEWVHSSTMATFPEAPL
jgi:hypothetical protein